MKIKKVEKEKKYCPSCQKIKLERSFGFRSGYQNKWRNSYCKKCMSNKAKEWRKNNREKFNKYQQDYQYRKYHNVQ